MSNNTTIVEQAVAKGGAYEIIRKRLFDQGNELDTLVNALNNDRQKEFGSTDMQILGRMRLRTENNCQATDLVTVGQYVLFGYNVFLGLKKETKLNDVLALFKLSQTNEQYELKSVPLENSFLNDQRFQTEFSELYAYYKDATLSQLVLKDGKLLASFKIGEKLTDIRVFRWEVNGDNIEYIDNRGERDLKLPASHDFEWVECVRDDVVDGRNPHVNILDTLFVDCLRGDITIKVENNTNIGKGIYQEPVEEKNQSINDAEFYYADLSPIILIKIKPYQEKEYRYLVFNKINQSIQRIDSIGDACRRLPEDHGIIFPGGIYLTTGETKTFDDNLSDLVYKRTMVSPNGEDVLYIFYQPTTNVVALYPYNIISKTLQNPLTGHGFGFYEDGRLIIFNAEKEPSRVHPIQIWQTAYFSDVFASAQPVSQSFFGKIGNAELVRGISELYSISKSVAQQDVSSAHYNELSKQCSKIFDSFYWLEDSNLTNVKQVIHKIGETCESVIDEYDKVETIRNQSEQALSDAISTQKSLLAKIQPDSWHNPQEFVDGLSSIAKQKGHLFTIKEYRYIDIDTIDNLITQLQEVDQTLNLKTVDFLSSEGALDSYYKDLDIIIQKSEHVKSNAELKPLIESITIISTGLDLISQIMSTLKVDDATLQTKIVDSVSTLYGKLNQQKAKLDHQQKSIGGTEAKAQFSARLKLLNQSIHNALNLADSPEACEEQSARILVQVEELESEFSDYDEFVVDIVAKRDEIFDAFESHKQTLIEQRQRKMQSLFDAGSRILNSVEKRTKRFNDQDQLNTFFAADGLISKIRDIIEQLSQLDFSVKAEDLDAKLKAIKAQALRSLRDKSDLFEDDGNVIKLGPRHKFSVNTQALDLSILPNNEQMFVRLSGTDYCQPLNHDALNQLKEYWSMQLPSENSQVYRGEFLAYSVLTAALQNKDGLTWQELLSASSDINELFKLTSSYAGPRYKEGYEKGIHDADASQILQKLVPSYHSAGVFIYSPQARGLACIFWANNQHHFEQWITASKNAKQMQSIFQDGGAVLNLVNDMTVQIKSFNEEQSLPCEPQLLESMSKYLIDELSKEQFSFSTTKMAIQLVDQFTIHLKSKDVWQDYQNSLNNLSGQVGKRWKLTQSWLHAFVNAQNKTEFSHFIDEAIGIFNADKRIDRNEKQIDIQFKITDLLGNHSNIKDQTLEIQLDVFLNKNEYFVNSTLPNFNQYIDIRSNVINEQKELLRLSEFKAKPLSSFVRNKLISEVYLPLIGDNLAKQMGTVGSQKRTDLMGLLLMISPPGYGKTTLMEYVADRLGLIFMKINCPVIGHNVTSVDPNSTQDSAAKQELEKLNLALEMGNNVMLYLDDIQHTNSEFLQKFISLCDGTRKIEGVWQGKTKTYDMRGKKFCVVMAGNPYTETGETFQIPDMLANRADIYNLGDVLSGKQHVFDLSYIENSLTSNPVLAPLATRDMADLYRFMDMVSGKEVATTQFSFQYSSAEIKDIVAVLSRLKKIQEVVGLVNRQYIDSSAQDDRYREEPAFKLQGSYRNMNKMVEKVSSIMTDKELNNLIDDHYIGESQLLTNGSESNLLKLGHLRNTLTEQEKSRWLTIKQDFKRNLAMGGDDTDSGQKIVGQLNDIVSAIHQWRESQSLEFKTAVKETVKIDTTEEIEQLINKLADVVNKDLANSKSRNEERLAKMLRGTFNPLIQLMTGKLDFDKGIFTTMEDINDKLEKMAKETQGK